MLNSRSSGPVDNRQIESRPDVMTFTTEPLTAPVEVIGPVAVTVRARGSRPYFDVFARLCDVDERGRSLSVCDGLVRRSPGQPEEVRDGWSVLTVPMSATAHRFAAGRRIRLQSPTIRPAASRSPW